MIFLRYRGSSPTVREGVRNGNALRNGRATAPRCLRAPLRSAVSSVKLCVLCASVVNYPLVRSRSSPLFDFFNTAFHVEVRLRHVVMLAIQNFFEPSDCLGHGHLLTLPSGEYLRHAEWLTEKTLNLSGPQNGQLVFRREFVHSENRDDVLQVFLALQHCLHSTRNVVVFLANDFGLERA